MIDYSIIRVGELEQFVQSAEYAQMPHVPISRIRALSHAQNPNARPDDPALVLALEDGRMAGYLGMIASGYKGVQEWQRAFFLSCMWVSDEFRGRGIAKTLMQKGYTFCNAKTFITNYHPASKAVFDATGQYGELITLEGIRGYFRFDFSGVIPRRYPFAKSAYPILRAFDQLMNTIRQFRIAKLKPKLEQGINYRVINKIDEDLLKPLASKLEKSLFHNDFSHLKWIAEYPWVTEVPIAEKEIRRYYFSQWRTQFKTRLVLLTTSDEKPIGLLMLVLTQNELKTPYLIYHDGYEANVARILVSELIASGAATLVCHHAPTVSELRKLNPFWWQRKSTYGFLVSKEIQPYANNTYSVYEGDGDSAFT